MRNLNQVCGSPRRLKSSEKRARDATEHLQELEKVLPAVLNAWSWQIKIEWMCSVPCKRCCLRQQICCNQCLMLSGFGASSANTDRVSVRFCRLCVT